MTPREKTFNITAASIISFFAIVGSLYGFHQWHKEKLTSYVNTMMEPKFDLVNIKLDMLLTDEQIKRAHERWKLIQEEQ